MTSKGHIRASVHDETILHIKLHFSIYTSLFKIEITSTFIKIFRETSLIEISIYKNVLSIAFFQALKEAPYVNIAFYTVENAFSVVFVRVPVP